MTVAAPKLATLRLWSGVVLFAFVATHLLNHLLGVFLVDAMEAARGKVMWAWRTPVGQVLLYGALLTHIGLTLATLYTRRHLRMPAAEAVQLSLGLLLPLLIAEHIASARLAETFLGVETTYQRFLLTYFVDEPWRVAQMTLLLVVVWLHGALGLHTYLRTKRWYAERQAMMVALAVLIPSLALAGVFASGVDLARRVADEPALAQEIWQNATEAPAAARGFIARWEIVLLILAASAMGGVFLARATREWAARRRRPVELRYAGRGTVVVPQGFSVLEASRFAGVPHASVCGGRGRCSTCRVRVLRADPAPAAPVGIERDTLARIAAGPDVRLACQLRPRGKVVVEPLLRPDGSLRSEAALAALAAGREMEIAALSVDLRRSSELAVHKLPFDVLYIVDGFLRVVTAAVRAEGGEVVTIAGDGLLAVFGLDGNPERACRSLLAAVRRVETGIAALNEDLSGELPWPLAFAAGGHVGTAVVGLGEFHRGVQFIGDTGNVAARLEEVAKERGARLVVSQRLATLAGLDDGPREEVALRGRTGRLAIAVFDEAPTIVRRPA